MSFTSNTNTEINADIEDDQCQGIEQQTKILPRTALLSRGSQRVLLDTVQYVSDGLRSSRPAVKAASLKEAIHYINKKEWPQSHSDFWLPTIWNIVSSTPPFAVQILATLDDSNLTSIDRISEYVLDSLPLSFEILQRLIGIRQLRPPSIPPSVKILSLPPDVVAPLYLYLSSFKNWAIYLSTTPSIMKMYDDILNESIDFDLKCLAVATLTSIARQCDLPLLIVDTVSKLWLSFKDLNMQSSEESVFLAGCMSLLLGLIMFAPHKLTDTAGVKSVLNVVPLDKVNLISTDLLALLHISVEDGKAGNDIEELQMVIQRLLEINSIQ